MPVLRQLRQGWHASKVLRMGCEAVSVTLPWDIYEERHENRENEWEQKCSMTALSFVLWKMASISTSEAILRTEIIALYKQFHRHTTSRHSTSFA
jgi:hypothetical protein